MTVEEVHSDLLSLEVLQKQVCNLDYFVDVEHVGKVSSSPHDFEVWVLADMEKR